MMSTDPTNQTTDCHFSPTGKALMDDEGRCTCEPVPADKPTTADIPVEARLQRTMQVLEQVFPGCSIALVVAPFGADPGRRANYIGNGKRDDVRVLLKEVISRWEGRHQEAPARTQ